MNTVSSLGSIRDIIVHYCTNQRIYVWGVCVCSGVVVWCVWTRCVTDSSLVVEALYCVGVVIIDNIQRLIK